MSQGFVFKAVQKAVVENAFIDALRACQEQILTDCNTYVKHLEGDLESSSQHNSKVKGLTLTLRWDTPYAKKQWYTGKPSAVSLSFHPKASTQWAVKAEAEYHDEWIKILEKEMGNNL